MVSKIWVPLSIIEACILSIDMFIPTKWQCIQWTELEFDLVLQEGLYVTLAKKISEYKLT